MFVCHRPIEIETITNCFRLCILYSSDMLHSVKTKKPFKCVFGHIFGTGINIKRNRSSKTEKSRALVAMTSLRQNRRRCQIFTRCALSFLRYLLTTARFGNIFRNDPKMTHRIFEIKRIINGKKCFLLYRFCPVKYL